MTDGFFTMDRATPIDAVNGGLFVSTGHRTESVQTHDSYEVIYLKRGALQVREESETFRIEQGQAILIRPGKTHRITVPESPEVAFYWVLFRAGKARERSGRDPLGIPRITTVPEPERLLELLHRYLDDLRTDRLSPLMGSHLVALILCEIARTVSAGRDGNVRNEELVDKILVHISRSFDTGISTSSVAENLNYNADYLERVFHAAQGMSITEAINRKRVREARRRLIHDYANVNEIALSCGFNDSGYFRRVFRRFTDMTPTRFRSLYSQVHVKID